MAKVLPAGARLAMRPSSRRRRWREPPHSRRIGGIREVGACLQAPRLQRGIAGGKGLERSKMYSPHRALIHYRMTRHSRTRNAERQNLVHALWGWLGRPCSAARREACRERCRLAPSRAADVGRSLGCVDKRAPYVCMHHHHVWCGVHAHVYAVSRGIFVARLVVRFTAAL